MATKKYVSFEKLGLYDEKIKKVISDSDANVLIQAKAYSDSKDSQFDAAGSAATVQGNLETEIARAKAAEEANAAAAKKAQDEVDALELVVETKAAQSDLDALAGKVGEVPADQTVMGIIENIQENAYDDTAIQQAVAGLEASKADKTKVAEDIASAKSELQGKIDLKAAQSDLDAVSAVANAAAKATDLEAEVNRAKGEEARIEGLVTAEKERAEDVEADFETRIAAMETFWDVTEDSDGVINKLKEIQDYIAGDESGAAEMLENIQANTQAIGAMDTAYKAADATLQGNIDALAGTVAGKAAQADLEALEERVETAEGDIDKNAEDIAALQAKFGDGEGSVKDMIDDAVAAEAELRVAGDEAAEASAAAALKAAQDAQKTADEAKSAAGVAQGEVDALEEVVATKAAASDLTALEERVETAEGEIDTLQSEMDAVEALAAANKAAHEANAAAIAKKADQTALQAEIERATAAEEALGARIDEFVEVSQEEIESLFK